MRGSIALYDDSNRSNWRVLNMTHIQVNSVLERWYDTEAGMFWLRPSSLKLESLGYTQLIEPREESLPKQRCKMLSDSTFRFSYPDELASVTWLSVITTIFWPSNWENAWSACHTTVNSLTVNSLQFKDQLASLLDQGPFLSWSTSTAPQPHKVVSVR